MGAEFGDLLLQVEYGRWGEGSNCPVEKSGQHSLGQVVRLSSVRCHVDSMSPGCDVMRSVLHLYGPPPQNPSQSKPQKKSAVIEGYCKTDLTNVLKIVKVMQNKESLRSCHRPEMARRHDD